MDGTALDDLKLNRPWLVAVWPGIGNVALTAGYYLMAKLGMHVLAELSAEALFDLEHVEVKEGLIRPGRRPRSRFFVWVDPAKERDILLFIGEAQPPTGKFAFCQKLIEYAQRLGVERVFTFAAMATHMHPKQPSRVFGAATDSASLVDLKRLELEILEEGHIGGLNGVLLGVAAIAGLRGICLLGEMPHVFSQLPFPKASLSVLKVFTMFAGIDIDFTELTEQAQAMEQQLVELLARVEGAMEQEPPAGLEETAGGGSEDRLQPQEREAIERLFEEARRDRSKAYELKRELDRLNVFKEYEDRFLDLFKKSS